MKAVMNGKSFPAGFFPKATPVNPVRDLGLISNGVKAWYGVYDPYLSEEAVVHQGVRFCSLKMLLQEADGVSRDIHLRSAPPLDRSSPAVCE